MCDTRVRDGKARCAFCTLIKAWRGFQQLRMNCSANQTAWSSTTQKTTKQDDEEKPKEPTAVVFPRKQQPRRIFCTSYTWLHMTGWLGLDWWSITCSPLSLIRCGSLDPSYPKRWQRVDNTRGQKLLSPPPLWCFWWFHRGTERHRESIRSDKPRGAHIITEEY